MLTTGANHGWSYRLERKIWFTCTWKKEQALDAFLCIDARRGAGNRQDNRQSTRIKFLAPPSSASHWKCHKVFEGFFYCVLLHESWGKSSRRHGLAGECHCTYLPQQFSACIVEFFLRGSCELKMVQTKVYPICVHVHDQNMFLRVSTINHDHF